MSNAFIIAIGIVVATLAIFAIGDNKRIDRENEERMHRVKLMRELRRYDEHGK